LYAIKNIQSTRQLEVKIASSVISLISVKRQRETNEITPTRAEQSSTYDNNEDGWGAHRAIDLNTGTRSHTNYHQAGAAWFKLTFDQEVCVEKVKLLYRDNSYAIWTCSKTVCSSCEGRYGDYKYCGHFTVTVTSSEGASSEGLIPASSCKFGNSVKVQNTDGYNRNTLWMDEIAVIGKKGE
jgi:hypothetical protein